MLAARCEMSRDLISSRFSMFRLCSLLISVSLCFLNYLAFLRPAADRADSILPWVVSRSRSYRFPWADSIIPKNVRKGDSNPAYSPESDRRRLTALFEVHRSRRVQGSMPKTSGPNSKENKKSGTFEQEGCAVSTWEAATLGEWEMEYGCYIIHRNHRVVACAGTQKHHLSGR
jgi:hypothetical protein